ncbi:MAG: chromosome segregation protein SMC [Planctomycetota bacterium]|nr:MAG: chromosome segregation protein SMC [Planctomycetota bacterium]
MYLKRIILHGFKSFADRTEFEFASGMTGIVGPNGCGKSNVLDAFRWVLGEQSARTLRGSKMLDVIFSGSRSRKPANFAEVQLHFDNRTGFLSHDAAEVSVSRVLYRNGDSEYRINGKACRLKDVRDLFLDTGVGRDAYSVIEQGRVDAMLRANPVQRRELFEEAAGVSRYKVRRAEAQRKLERAQANLLRLGDVIEELEKRLRSVKLAAGKARNYKEYDARLRELRSTYALAEYHELVGARRRLEQRCRALQEVLAAKRVGLARRDADAAELEHQRQDLDERIHAAEQASAEVESELSAIEERIVHAQRRLEELREAGTRAVEQEEQVRRQLDEARSSAEQARVDAAESVAAERERAQLLERLRGEREAVAQRGEQARSELEQERRAAFEAARHATVLRNEHANLIQQAQRIEAQQQTIAERRRQAQSRRDDAEQQCAVLDARIEELDRAAGELSAEAQSLEASLEEAEAARRAAEREIAGCRERRSACMSRLAVLDDLEARREGVQQGARDLLSWRDQGSSDHPVVGLVADLLRVSEAHLDRLRAILPQFENIVVVRDLAALLAEVNRRGEPSGRVEIVALDRIGGAFESGRYRDAPGVLACAADWVECSPEYRPLAEALFGRVYAVDSLERALAIADGAPEGYLLITPEGDAVGPGGRLATGRASGDAGLISRKSEIRRLRAEVDEIETDLERRVRASAEIEQRISDQRLQREAVLQRLADLQRRHADARTQRARLEDELARAQRESELLSQDASDLEQTLAQVRERSAQVRVEQAASDDSVSDHERRVAELEAKMRDAFAAVTRIAHEVSAAEVEQGRAVERRAAREAAAAELDRRVAQLQEELERLRREDADRRQRLKSADAELRDSRRRAEELAELRREREAQAAALRDARHALRRRLESCSALVRRLHGEIEQIESAAHEDEVALREAVVRQENLVARVRDELSLELPELYRDYEHVDREWDAIREEIDELRKKIARLGNVNLDALAELEELQPRYENLVAQRSDLTESISRLERLIEQLDDESRARFLSCFEEVRANFQTLFRKLFGGGKADVLLEDEERPLECGIEIIARPPGKEPQTLTLLSGGEKTMAAVALLFAVYQRKPSPFAFLDEVDAALDESNIDRFNTMLSEFLTQSQFIIITHNKRTMQCADTLYGVTMEEPGVSKRVSVRFDDRVDTPNVA